MAPINHHDHLNLIKAFCVQFERKDLFQGVDLNKVQADLDVPSTIAVTRRWERLYNTFKEMDAKGEKFGAADAATPKTKATPKKRKLDMENADPDAVPETPTKKARGRPKKFKTMTVEEVEAAAAKERVAASGAEENDVVAIAAEEMEE